MSSKNRLSKEGIKAIKVFVEAFKHCENHSLLSTLRINGTNIETGFSAFSSNKIVLERGADWRWNRSVCIKEPLNVSEDVLVSVEKMNSRSKHKGITVPSFKVWLFTVQSADKTKPIYFVWCERGLDPAAVSIEEFAFLRPFVSDAIAQEFNWSL